MVHTDGTYQRYVRDQENVMTQTSSRPGEISYERAARGMAAATRPTALGAWRAVSRTGGLPGDPDPDSTAAGLVRRWHQHLAVAIDLPMERLAPGADRLPELVTAWLDLARRTEAVRRHVAATGGSRTAAEQARQADLLTRLLAEDLALLGAVAPRRSAHDLLLQLQEVAAAEDAAGRVLRSARRTLVAAPSAPEVRARRWRLPRWAGHALAG
jgi:hypothetical protein